MDKRAAKRWKRENRPNKGQKFIPPHCARCGHKLTRHGCPQCNPNIWNVADDLVGKGDISRLHADVMLALAQRSRSR